MFLTSFSYLTQAHQLQQSPGEDESLELVPNITLNPSFNIDMLEHIEPEFNESRSLKLTDIVLYIITVFGKNKKSLSNLQLDIKLKQFFHFQRTYFSCYNSGETKSIIIIFYLYFISMHFINNLFTTSCIVQFSVIYHIPSFNGILSIIFK